MNVKTKRFTGIALILALAFAMGGFALTRINATVADSADFTTAGASVRLDDPSGLRFTTKVSESYIAELDAEYGAGGYQFGTLLLPKALLGENELTAETDLVLNQPRTKWGETAEEGFKAYHVALTGITAENYGTEICARSYVRIPAGNGYTYVNYSDGITRSIGVVAQSAILDGEEDELLTTYLNGAVKGVTVDATAELDIGGTYVLTATTSPAGYKVAFSTSDPQVATVSENGVITGISAGNATVTVSVADKTATCAVTVSNSTVITFDNYSVNDWVVISQKDRSVLTKSVDTDAATGNKYFTVALPDTGYSAIFNIPVPQSIDVTGKLYTVSVDAWLDGAPSADNIRMVLVSQTVANNPTYDYSGSLSASNLSTTFTFKYSAFSDGRLRTIYLFNPAATGTVVHFDNIKFTPMEDPYIYADTEVQEVTVDAGATVDLTDIVTVYRINGTTVYGVTDKDGNAVAVSNGAFTAGNAQNYYDITVAAEYDGRTSTAVKVARVIVKGTYIATSGYSAVSYSGNELTATKLNNDSLTNFKLYLDGLENYADGELVTVTLNYRADVQSVANQKFLVIGKNTGNNPYPAITNGVDETLTFVAAVCTYEKDFTGLINLASLSGKSAKHVKIETWFYQNNVGHVTGTFTIKSAYVSKINGNADVVSGGKFFVNSDRNIVFQNTGDWSQYRLYLDDLNAYSAGQIVQVTMKYKTSGATVADKQFRIIYGKGAGTTTDFFNVTKDGNYSTVQFNAMVYTGDGQYPTSGGATISGSLEKHLKLTTLFTANATGVNTKGIQIIIDSITVTAV